MATLLRARLGECVVLLAMKCSSFSIVNMGTSMRTVCCPLGDWTKMSVAQANVMASRSHKPIELAFLVNHMFATEGP